MRPFLQPPPPLAGTTIHDGSAVAPADDVTTAGVMMSLAGGGQDPVEQRDNDGDQTRDQQGREPAAGATPGV